MPRYCVPATLCAALLATVLSAASLPPLHYRYDLQWGEPGEGDGQMVGPMRLNIRGSTLLMTDRDNNRVQLFSLDGAFLGKWGTYGTGRDNLHYPFDADFDGQGNLYALDFGNGCVKVRDPSFGYLRQFASDGSGAEQIMGPRGLAIDRTGGYLYIADTLNDRISKWTTAGTHLMNFGTSGEGQLYHPYDCAYSNNRLYVADTENNRIVVFTANGGFVRQWDGSGGGGALAWPPAVSVSGSKCFVCDGDNSRVVVYTTSGEYISEFGSYGHGDGEFDMPAGVVADSAGHVFVADGHNNRMQRFRLNARPSPATLTVSPASPADSDSLTATRGPSSDADGDALSYSFRWFESTDNANWRFLRNGRVLSASQTVPGRWYRCRARAYDGYDYSGWKQSASVRVGGTAPAF